MFFKVILRRNSDILATRNPQHTRDVKKSKHAFRSYFILTNKGWKDRVRIYTETLNEYKIKVKLLSWLPFTGHTVVEEDNDLNKSTVELE